MSLLDGGPLRLVARGLQLCLIGLIGYGAAIGEVGITINGVLALGVALLPDALQWWADHEVDPRIALWITVAALVHTVGFFGPYDWTTGIPGLYDQAAHAISASFVAGVGYALVEALDRSSTRVHFPPEFRFVFILAFILAFGVAWEIAEFGGGALGSAITGSEFLVQYGIRDIVADLVFNTLAAAAVALWGTGYFDGVATIFTRHLSGGRRQ